MEAANKMRFYAESEQSIRDRLEREIGCKK
jgi:hypothetical protein